jgi:hypothetical protein
MNSYCSKLIALKKEKHSDEEINNIIVRIYNITYYIGTSLFPIVVYDIVIMYVDYSEFCADCDNYHEKYHGKYCDYHYWYEKENIALMCTCTEHNGKDEENED